MKEWGPAREAENAVLVKNYPSMRELTGEYQMHRVTLAK